MADRRLMVAMRMHRAEPGQCWADSEQLKGYTAAGADFGVVMDLVSEALGNGMLIGALDPDLIDLRWQWCDDPARSVLAIRDVTGGLNVAPTVTVCPCSREAP
jgi:hypothetical protein